MDTYCLPAHQPSAVSVEGLDHAHYHALVRAIHKVFSTELAEVTLALLFDGLPLVQTVFDVSGQREHAGHPLLGHASLCDGAMDRIAPPGSREFAMCLAELVATSIHQIGVPFFLSASKIHSEDEIRAVVSFEEEPQWETLGVGRRIPLGLRYIPPQSTLFVCRNYSRPAPFPIEPSSANRQRHDPWDAMAWHQIFQDPWERKIPSRKPDSGGSISTG
ncbi:247f220e-790b-4c41-a267-c208d96b1743 [Thermothielavioides terrestris]|uniref:247f220e-790b-4c41-a267-c208d96b1743 n=1 Tax=Thermothielavioides terrestris TaxID=2587410 RepID=A0A3S4F2Z9_9PEZI|nr:247f220e-790b-4c41-a267-c208d96b1743 [Thermothielavioides terrestris]